MNRWPSLLLFENTLQLPVKYETAHTALYHLRAVEFDHNVEGERIIRPYLRRVMKAPNGLYPPAVFEVSEHVRIHPGVANDYGLLHALLGPFDLTREMK
jgi:hypothetical protein